jgi:peptide-methionine (S)-S-oxide reductase
MKVKKDFEIATLAGGCFWCTEAIFQKLKGVMKVTSGYTGGHTSDPHYMQIVSGNTGHAESIQIEFDPSVISYKTILDVFFATHDPTSLNRQGADTGEEYRSAIFYHDSKQQSTAEKLIQELDASKRYSSPVVTEVVPYLQFYPGEDYHQDFFKKNKENYYCQIIIDPKIRKLLSLYKPLVKEESAEL